jgi:hypothetical protein
MDMTEPSAEKVTGIVPEIDLRVGGIRVVPALMIVGV